MTKKKIVFQKIRGERLDRFIASEVAAVTRSSVRALIEKEKIFVNGHIRKPSHLLKRGDEIEIFLEKPKKALAVADASVAVKIIAVAKDYIVIDKPADIITHPNLTKENKSVIEGVLAKYPEIANIGEDALRPGIVHRLDRGTSGVMVIARTKKGFLSLKKQFQKRTVQKEYLALVYGSFKENHGEISYDIVRSKHNPTQWIALRGSDKAPEHGKGKVRNALTEYYVKEQHGYFTLLRVLIHTGRTHQIRVHMKAISHPVVGDEVYTTRELRRAKVPFALHRCFLHAARLSFDDPATLQRVTYTSNLPKTLKEFLRKLKS